MSDQEAGVTARLFTSDLWHKTSSVGDDEVTLVCTGKTVQRDRVLLDSLGVNVTCLRCQRHGKCRRCKGKGYHDGRQWGQNVCVRCDGTGREPTDV